MGIEKERESKAIILDWKRCRGKGWFSPSAILFLLAVALLLAGSVPAHSAPNEKPQVAVTANDEAWKMLRAAMLAFQDGGSREDFLAICKKLLADYPGSRYDAQLRSLIEPLERDATAPTPQWLQTPAEARTSEENVRYWIFQLREVAGRQFFDPGYPDLFAATFSSNVAPMPTDELVAIGPPAIPYLIEALDDDTPTRTIAWQRSFYPIYFVLRRQDLAMKCLERITGCDFYDEGSTSTHLHNDTPERRASAIANVRAWWKISQAVGQAQMIRNQLALRSTNLTLRGYDEVRALEMLAVLEGPESVIGRMRALLTDDRYGLNSPIVEAMESIDRLSPVRAAFARFHKNETRGGDYTLLYRYGDRAIYQEMTKRYTATGQLDPGGWSLGDQMARAARYGQNWAIPLLAKTLEKSEITGSRSVEGVGSQSFSNADIAIEHFQKLTGRDFGYRREDSLEKRLAAIAKARAWWEEAGSAATQQITNADHPLVEPHGDLFLTDAQIFQRVAALTGVDAGKRRKAVANLEEVFSYQIQRALLQALDRESEPAERLRILQLLKKRPAIWHLPRLALILERDRDTRCRVLAGQIIQAVVTNKMTSLWWSRLESREAGLDAARRLVKSQDTATPVREVSIAILRAWDALEDRRLLKEIGV